MTVKVSSKQQCWWVALTELSLLIAAASHLLEWNRCLPYQFWPIPPNWFLCSVESVFTVALFNSQKFSTFPVTLAVLKASVTYFQQVKWSKISFPISYDSNYSMYYKQHRHGGQQQQQSCRIGFLFLYLAAALNFSLDATT